MPSLVDLRALKAAAQRLPLGHPLRDAVLATPDQLSREEAAPALEVIIRLAWVHRRT